MEYVYFIKHKGLSPIKIGRTNDFSKRIHSFKNASPYGVEIIGIIETNNSLKMERFFHSKFKDFRLNGEWFEIPIDVAKGMVAMYKDKEYIEAKNNFEISYHEFKITKNDENEDMSTHYLNDLVSINYDKNKGFVNCIIANQKELSDILKINKKTIKEFLEYIGCPYKSYRTDLGVKNGYKVFLKQE